MTRRILALGIPVLFFTALGKRANADSWTALASQAPAALDTMLLLTDGSVMALDRNNNQTWLKLTPDSHGSYVNGTWSTLANMHFTRLYFASQVLQNGKVWVLGGEYTGPFYDPNVAPTGELYDPIANTWSPVATFPNQAACSANNRTFSVTSDVNLTSGSPVVTGIYSTDRIQPGWTVIATASNSTDLFHAAVVSVDSPTQVTLNRSAGETAASELRFNGPVAACFGDDPSILLPGGNILAGSILTNGPYLYSIATDSWTPAGVKVYNDPSDEEGWAILDDNRVVNYDLFQSVGSGQGFAEIYNPSTNLWASISPADGTAGGVLPVLSSSALGYELGPLLRLQDGRVLVIGANQHTALYAPSTNLWAAGPDMLQTLSNPYGSIPNATFGADDAPAAELPNGHVIVATDAGPNPVTENASTTAASPTVTVPSTAGFQPFWAVKQANGHTDTIPPGTFIYSVNSATQITLGTRNGSGTVVTTNALLTNPSISLVFGGIFSNPTQLFDFDPVAGTMTPIASPSPHYPDNPSYVSRMLMLPTGQLLLNDSSNQLYVYTPNGGASLFVRPTINNVVNNGSGTYTLTGKQLNGQSAGAAYGDDVQMNENYPIVRLSTPAAPGHTCNPDAGVCTVYYARTTNWSSVAVGGGATAQTVNFTLPAGISPGNYLLTVTGAGITSLPIAFTVTP